MPHTLIALEELEQRLTEDVNNFELIEMYINKGVPNALQQVQQTIKSLHKKNKMALGPLYAHALFGRVTGNEQQVYRMSLELLRREPDAACILRLFEEPQRSVIVAEGQKLHQLDNALVPLRALATEEKWQTVVPLLREMIRNNPDYSRAQNLFFQACASSANVEAAREMQAFLTSHGFELHRISNLMGQVYEAVGQDDEALEQYLLSLRHKPDYQPPVQKLVQFAKRSSIALFTVQTKARQAVSESMDPHYLTPLFQALQRLEPPSSSPPSSSPPSSSPSAHSTPPTHTPEELVNLFREAAQLDEKGNTEKAAKLYVKIAMENPSLKSFHYAGKQLEQKKQWGRALALYSQAIRFARTYQLPEAPQKQAHDRVLTIYQRQKNAPPKKSSPTQKKQRFNTAPTALQILTVWMEHAHLQKHEPSIPIQEREQDLITLIASLEEQSCYHIAGFFVQVLEELNPRNRRLVEDLKARLNRESLQEHTIRPIELYALLTFQATNMLSWSIPQFLAQDPDSNNVWHLVVALRKKENSPIVPLLEHSPHNEAGAFFDYLLGRQRELDTSPSQYPNTFRSSVLEYSGLLALFEERWSDAMVQYLLAEQQGLELAFALYQLGDISGAFRLIRPLDELMKALEEEVILPSPLELSGSKHKKILAKANKAWKEFQQAKELPSGPRRDQMLERAAFLYSSLAQNATPLPPAIPYNEALIRMELQQFEHAALLLQTARNEKPHDPNIVYAHAVCQWKLQLWVLARDSFQALFKLSPDYRRSISKPIEAACLIQLKQLDQAAQVLKTLDPKSSSDIAREMLLRCGEQSKDATSIQAGFRLLLPKERTFSAATLFPGTKSPLPRSPQAVKRTTRIAPSEHTQPTRVTPPEHLPGMVSTKPPPPQPVLPSPNIDKLTYPELVEAVERRQQDGRLEESIEWLEAWIKKTPGYVPARQLLAQTLEKAGRWEAAKRQWFLSYQRSQEHFKTRTVRALLRFLTDYALHATYAQAAECLLDVQPRHMKDWRSLQAVQQLTNQDKTDLCRFILVLILKEREARDQARLELKVVLRNRPNDERVIAFAKEWAPDLLNTNRIHPQYIRSEWERYERLYQYDEGIAYLEQTLKLEPDSPELVRLLGEAYTTIGWYDKAINLLTKQVQWTGAREDRLLLASALGRKDDVSPEEVKQYLYLLGQNPFDPDVHQRMISLSKKHQLPCLVEDELLLKRCYNVFARGGKDNQEQLAKELLEHRPREEAKGICKVLCTRQPYVQPWQTLAEALGIYLPQISAEDEFSNREKMVLEDGIRRLDIWSECEEFLEGWEERTTQLCLEAWNWYKSQPLHVQSNDPIQALQAMIAWARSMSIDSGGIVRAYYQLQELWLYRILVKKQEQDHTNFLSRFEKNESITLKEILRSLQREFLPRAFQTAMELKTPASLTFGKEVTSVAVHFAGEYLDALQSQLRYTSEFAEKVEEHGHTKQLQQRKLLSADAYQLRDHIVRDDNVHLPRELQEALHNLIEYWRGILDERNESMNQIAHLVTTIRTLSGDEQARTFQLCLELTNTGDAPARAIQFHHKNNPTFQLRPLEERKGLELLPNEHTTLTYEVQVLEPHRRAVEFEGKLHYAATMDGLEDTHTTAQVIKVPWVTIPPSLPNEYTVGARVRPGDPTFVQRTALIQQIRDALGHENSGNVVMLYGWPRIGKSCLLSGIQNACHEWGFPVMFDMQGEALQDVDTGGLLYKLCKSIAEVLQRGGAPPQLLPESMWKDSPTICLQEFIEEIRMLTRRLKKRVLLLIDEFDILFKKIKQGHIEEGILSVLRNLMQHEPGLAFVIAGSHRLIDIVQKYDNVLFQLAIPFRLDFLMEEEARWLITSPVKAYLTFEPSAIKRIVTETAGYPYFVQQVCQDLVAKASGSHDHITGLDVLQVIQSLITRSEHNTVYRVLYEDSQLDPVSQCILGAIAEHVDEVTEHVQYCRMPSIIRRLEKLSFTCSEELFFKSIKKLKVLGMIHVRNTPDGSREYSMALPLLARWIQCHRDLESYVLRAKHMVDQHNTKYHTPSLIGTKEESGQTLRTPPLHEMQIFDELYAREERYNQASIDKEPRTSEPLLWLSNEKET